jgi:hypothetical protein
MENWLKTKVSSSTGYAAVELLTRETKSDLFRELLKKISEQLPEDVSGQDKLLQAYARMI